MKMKHGFLYRVRAFHVYKEALKCSYDNWHIWENFLTVGLQTSLKTYAAVYVEDIVTGEH